MSTVRLSFTSMIRILFGALVAASATMLGCEADMEEGCLSGPCGPDAQASVESTATSSGSGGGGGGTPALPPCSDPQAMDEGDLPCDVHKILVENCQCCHQSPETKNAAPFFLMRWEDTQKPYGAGAIWNAMQNAIMIDFMPLQGSLTQAEKDVLNAWFAAGAPADTRAGDCECSAEFQPPATCNMD